MNRTKKLYFGALVTLAVSFIMVVNVALVQAEGIDRDRAYFVGGNPAITVRIDRSERGDAIKIQRQVESVVSVFATLDTSQLPLDFH